VLFALLAFARRGLAGERVRVESVKGVRVLGVFLEDLRQRGRSLGAKTLVDRGIVHEHEGLRDGALDLVGLEGRVAGEGPLELALQSETAAEGAAAAAEHRPAAAEAAAAD